MLSYMSCLYILDINPLSVRSFGNILSYFIGCLFVGDLLCRAKAFSLIRPHLLIFAFISFDLGGR